MQNDARRAEILSTLAKSQRPISATTLAAAYHVSRQSIVGDIALLRASGADIIATSRGYLLAAASRQPLLKKTIACRHDAAAIREELYIAVDEGCTVADVSVEHPLYGELRGQLQLSSRHEVDAFLARSAECAAQPLSLLTSGIHLHTLLCPDEAAYRRVTEKLRTAGILLSE
ncbi:transcription repressor NadR [Stomatobaculum longum]|uniref:transcription repressor NadR n=1 Tax=Stomatobaculum longum TaxID=796942 RepID=UPI0028EC94F7|nr:transcription repressor NadR [Stomatobaculum longum]